MSPKVVIPTNRLLFVSNRLPIRAEERGDDLVFVPSTGGLATGLRSFYREHDSRWIGWSGLSLEEISNRKQDIEHGLHTENCIPVHLTRSQVERYYHGYSNETIWPLFHYFQQYARFENELWQSYQEVNHAFADTVAEFARPGDRIWVHDYHLMLLPRLLRERIPEAEIGFFLHIPFPSFELFRLLPEREEIIKGLLGADLIGFQAYDYARHFFSSVLRLTGYEQQLNLLSVEGRKVKVDVFPIGIDYQRWAEASEDETVAGHIQVGESETGGKRVILSVDRLDYTKGIVNRLKAFDLFLEQHPRYRDEIVFILLTVPSRTSVPYYDQLKQEVDELVGNINSRHGNAYSAPISYMYRSLDFSQLAALYALADIALITPLRDGMNLVAKEYVATKRDDRGVLILSEMAGASMELSEAITVNPNNTLQISASIAEAIEMDEEEQQRRMRSMRERIRRYDINRWAQDFLENLEEMSAGQGEDDVTLLSGDHIQDLLEAYQESKNRLLLIDYDGTLVPFSNKPEDARPDEQLLLTLNALNEQMGNSLVIVSGRNKTDLDDFFSGLDLNLVAEHGAWIRERGRAWRQLRPLDSEWKETIRPVLEFFVDRTPGSSLEEKDYSLVWHYRRSDPELAHVRAKELLFSLYNQTANMELDVLEGNKVIEVCNAEVNKGRAALQWLEKNKWGFLLAVGDDNTDEDLFTAMPERAFTCKVGTGDTKAGYRVSGYQEVRTLLEGLRKA